MCGNCDIVPPVVLAPVEVFTGVPLQKVMQVQRRLENGVYTRTGKIPAGGILLGCEHRKENIFHLTKGSLILWDKKNGMRHVTAPFSEVTVPGIQRVGFALDEVEGCNILKTEKLTVEEAEAEMFFPFVEPPGVMDELQKLLCG